MSDLVLQDTIGRQANRVACTLGFEELINLGIREGCVTPEIQMLRDAPVTRDHRLQQRAPAVSTMDVARSQRAPFDIAELVEHEERVVAGAAKVAIIGTAFLFAIGRAFARIHVEYDGLRPSPPAHFVNPLTGQIGESDKVLGPAQPLCLKAPHLAGRGGRPAYRPVANHPAHCWVTTQPLASFTSSYPASRPNTAWRRRPASRCRPFLPVRASASVSAAVSVRHSVSSNSR